MDMAVECCQVQALAPHHFFFFLLSPPLPLAMIWPMRPLQAGAGRPARFSHMHVHQPRWAGSGKAPPQRQVSRAGSTHVVHSCSWKLTSWRSTVLEALLGLMTACGGGGGGGAGGGEGAGAGQP